MRVAESGPVELAFMAMPWPAIVVGIRVLCADLLRIHGGNLQSEIHGINKLLARVAVRR